jgi:DNA-binding XRE family transcriptional regulator
MMAQHNRTRDNRRLGIGGPKGPPLVYPSRMHRTLAQRLRGRRIAAGLTLHQAAAAAGITAAAWSAYERGRTLPSLPVLASVAAAVGCDPADLVP